jgi:hypothetical protein
MARAATLVMDTPAPAPLYGLKPLEDLEGIKKKVLASTSISPFDFKVHVAKKEPLNFFQKKTRETEGGYMRHQKPRHPHFLPSITPHTPLQEVAAIMQTITHAPTFPPTHPPTFKFAHDSTLSTMDQFNAMLGQRLAVEKEASQYLQLPSSNPTLVPTQRFFVADNKTPELSSFQSLLLKELQSKHPHNTTPEPTRQPTVRPTNENKQIPLEFVAQPTHGGLDPAPRESLTKMENVLDR